LTRITRERGALSKDDRIDVLAMAVAYWTEQMNKDVLKTLQDHRAAMHDAALEQFLDDVFGRTSAGPSWSNTEH
jgi:hypothetical protein